jgi:NAD/NADP transhydrogenase alpha subunit
MGMLASQHASRVVGHVNTPGSIASRFFGQNQQEFQQQSTQNPDEDDENIDEEIVNIKSAIQ